MDPLEWSQNILKWIQSQPFQDWWLSDSPPTWFAFLGAAIAVTYTYKEHKRSVARDVEEQASRVAVWPNKANPNIAGFGLINSSPGPVSSVVVYAYSWPAGDDARRTLSKYDVGATPPYGEPRFFFTGAPLTGDHSTSGYNYALSFRDSRNRDWHRTKKGELRRGQFPDDNLFESTPWPAPPGHGSPNESFAPRSPASPARRRSLRSLLRGAV